MIYNVLFIMNIIAAKKIFNSLLVNEFLEKRCILLILQPLKIGNKPVSANFEDWNPVKLKW